MRTPLIAGREFDVRDRRGAPPGAIVNETWLKVNLEGRNAVGEHVVSYSLNSKPQEMEIAGVAKNARYDDLTGDFPGIVYIPFAQHPDAVDDMTFFLRSPGDPLRFANSVREVVRQADSRIPITNLGTQSMQIQGEMRQQTLFARRTLGRSEFE